MDLREDSVAVDAHALLIQESLGMLLATLPTVAAMFVAAEAHGGVYHPVAVDPDRPRFDSMHHLVHRTDALSPHRSGKSVFGVVCEAQCLLSGVKRNHRNDRSKDLLASNLHFVRHI